MRTAIEEVVVLVRRLKMMATRLRSALCVESVDANELMYSTHKRCDCRAHGKGVSRRFGEVE